MDNLNTYANVYYFRIPSFNFEERKKNKCVRKIKVFHLCVCVCLQVEPQWFFSTKEKKISWLDCTKQINRFLFVYFNTYSNSFSVHMYSFPLDLVYTRSDIQHMLNTCWTLLVIFVADISRISSKLSFWQVNNLNRTFWYYL